jgi:hypothetical protein
MPKPQRMSEPDVEHGRGCPKWEGERVATRVYEEKFPSKVCSTDSGWKRANAIVTRQGWWIAVKYGGKRLSPMRYAHPDAICKQIDNREEASVGAFVERIFFINRRLRNEPRAENNEDENNIK